MLSFSLFGTLFSKNVTLRAALPGSLDSTYLPVLDGEVRAIVPLSGDKSMIGGAFTKISAINRGGVARLNADGTVDSSFDPGSGITGTPEARINAILVQPDGKVLVGGRFGQFNGVSRSNLVRLNNDGNVDLNFSANCSVINCLALQADGKILFGSTATEVASTAALVRLKDGGEPDPEFQAVNLYGWFHAYSNITPKVFNIAVLSNGQILFQGFFSKANQLDYYGLARLESDGRLDTNFSCIPEADRTLIGMMGGPYPAAASMAVEPDGKILVGCGPEVFGTWKRRLVRLNSKGELDISFNPYLPVELTYTGNSISSITSLAGNKILVSGDFNAIAGQPRNHLACLDSSGGLDLEFDPNAGVDKPISAVALQADGQFLLGGTFTKVNGVERPYLARLRGISSTVTNPTIVVQPASINALPGESVRFSVTADGGSLKYQWLFQTTPIAGATNAQLNLTNVQSAAAGKYSVIVSNNSGSITSSNAVLSIHSFAESVNMSETEFSSQFGLWVMGYWQELYSIPGWFYQTNITHDGTGAIQVLTLPHSSLPSPRSLLKTTIQGPGNFSFWWKCGGQGYMNFSVSDGESLFLKTFEDVTLLGWQQTRVSIPPGYHAVTWDCYCPSGTVCVLDEFSFMPTASIFPLTSAHYSAASGFQFSIIGPTNEVFRLEWSEDLKNWMSWMTVSNLQHGIIIDDPKATNRIRSFYRAVK